ncbi:hypothetical protein V3391_06680 [Luteimonas sp. SMYT11W]|uniref:Uncharacterized protein n=1 Tax=Luteimonas flava TaxID=3115822 RepID=A0ABU7WD39_9GAMM
MSRTRLLTDPDEVAASDAFKRAAVASRKAQTVIANEIGDGVSQGTVWQWANRRLAIPAARAVEAARAVGARPEEISVAYRALSNEMSGKTHEQHASYRASQNLGIPLSTISDAMLVVKAYVEDRGLPVTACSDPLLIKTAIDLVNELAVPLSLTNVITFKRRFTEKLEGGNDGSSEVAATG